MLDADAGLERPLHTDVRPLHADMPRLDGDVSRLDGDTSRLDADSGTPSADAGLDRALAIAYRYLNARERTEAEMRGHLLGKRTDPSDIEPAVQALIDQGLLDDACFARLFVQDKRELAEWGADRIRQALLARGVDRDVVADALAEHEQTADGDEIDRALAVLRRRFPSPAGDRRERERALGVLLRKGYDTDLALEAINAHMRDPDPG
ncbi:MAG: regulatory protein RecX [Solirubrobacteraceae bacterium]